MNISMKILNELSSEEFKADFDKTRSFQSEKDWGDQSDAEQVPRFGTLSTKRGALIDALNEIRIEVKRLIGDRWKDVDFHLNPNSSMTISYGDFIFVVRTINGQQYQITYSSVPEEVGKSYTIEEWKQKIKLVLGV